jgi:hypothetical protein
MSSLTFPRSIAPLLLAALAAASPSFAQSASEDRLRALEMSVEALTRQMKDKDQKIAELETKVRQLSGPEELAKQKAQASQDALDAMLKDIDKKEAAAPGGTGGKPALGAVNLGPANLRLIDLSMDFLFSVGGSTAKDDEIRRLEGGGHDPARRGFTFSQAELSAFGAIDPYFNGETHIVFLIDPETGETSVELEEAYLTTTTLPWGLQVKAGYYLTEFGRINPTHPHAWDFLDQPIISSRVFGPDGLRQTGARVAWLAPLPWFSELYLGIQNASGETTASFDASGSFFNDRPIGGRPWTQRDTAGFGDMLYSARWANSFDITDEVAAIIGGSAVYGPNATGSAGHTWIYGADLTIKYKPTGNNRGWPFVTWQTEIIRRDYHADAGVVDPDRIPGGPDDVAIASDDLHDWGFYTQVIYGFIPDWAAGLRYEYVTASGQSVDPLTGAMISHNDDPFRDDRHRISPLLMWRLSEFSRLRLQYNYDHAAHLNHDAHSVWLGIEVLFGAHPAHNY